MQRGKRVNGEQEKKKPVKTQAVPDNTKLVDPENVVVSGQLESGLIMHACPVTEVGRRLLGIT